MSYTVGCLEGGLCTRSTQIGRTPKGYDVRNEVKVRELLFATLFIRQPYGPKNLKLM